MKKKTETTLLAKKNAAPNKLNRGNDISNAYDAADVRNRRRTKFTNLRSEDDVLKTRDRDRVISEARLLRRNAAVVRWAISKHLDYVSTFNFQCRTGNKKLDDQIEALISWWNRPFNCDVSGRHSLHQLIRIAEGLATTDGDCFVMKLSDGHVQIIEGDRVRTPTNLGEYTDLAVERFVHGVDVTAAGKALRYAICDREMGNFVLSSVVPAKYIFQHGYFDRYDQIRGISPLASAINTFCDIYEAQEYALAKAKLAQLFLLKFSRSAPAEGPTDAAGKAEPYSFDFGSGPQAVELDPGDEAEFLESDTPSTQFQAFMQAGIQMGLKSLDIPYSYYAENYSTYSGSRQAMLIYEQSCAIKRQRVKQLLTNLTLWRLSLFIEDGELVLPDGMTIEDLNFEYIPAPLPWIDPQKDADASISLVSAGLKSRQEISRERGKDWYEIADQIADEDAYLAKKGIDGDATIPAGTSNDEDDE